MIPKPKRYNFSLQEAAASRVASRHVHFSGVVVYVRQQQRNSMSEGRGVGCCCHNLPQQLKRYLRTICETATHTCITRHTSHVTHHTSHTVCFSPKLLAALRAAHAVGPFTSIGAFAFPKPKIPPFFSFETTTLQDCSSAWRIRSWMPRATRPSVAWERRGWG